MSVGRTLVASDNPTGVAPPGAIVGENPAKPWAATTLPAGVYLTTGDLGDGDSGDAGALGGFTVEFWILTVSVTPGSNQQLIMGPNAHAPAPGRQYSIVMNVGGTVAFTYRDDTDTNTSVTSAAGLKLNQWNHVVCVYDGPNNDLNIYLDGVLSATVGGVGNTARNDLIAGSADFRIGQTTTTLTFGFDEVAFYRTPLAASRVAAHYQAGVSRGFPTQVSGTRVNAVLDSVSSHASRTVNTGARSVTPAYMSGQNPLTELRRARSADAVDALLFVARDGKVTYLDASHRSSSPYNTVQATFDDDGTDLPYHGLQLDYSESYLTNEWNVTRVGIDAVTQTVTDATSVARYFKRPAAVTDLPVASDGDASTIAAAMLAKYKEPLTRVTEISLSTDDPAVTETAFRRDIGDRIRVFRTPPGGGARIDQTLFIQQIQVDAAPGGPWRVTWAVSPV